MVRKEEMRLNRINKYICNIKNNETEKLSITLSIDSMHRLIHLMVQDINDVIQNELKNKNFDVELFQYIFYKYNELVTDLDRSNQEYFTFYVDEDYLNKYLIPFTIRSIDLVEGYNVEGYESFIKELKDKILK